jgi:CRISPR-associated endonuclease Cas3-HD
MTVRFSHPPEDGHEGVELQDHLNDVARRVRQLVSADVTTPAEEAEPLRRVIETLAYVHDFGKATTYFQEYLCHGTEPDTKQWRYHAPVGSFAAYYALDVQGFETETCLAGFVAVAKHHGRLPDVAAYIHRRADRRDNVSAGSENEAEQQQSAIGKQLQNIHTHAEELAADVFEKATDGNGSWTGFCSSFTDLLDEIASAVEIEDGDTFTRSSLSESCYGLVLECWGTLVFADKTSAATHPNEKESEQSPYAAEPASLEALAEYIDELESSSPADPDGTRAEQLNHYRARARSSITENATTFAKQGGGVATLTLPTGMGKTLSGLSAAETIRDELGGQRVIYALPFTSIIDQVVDELEDIYETDTLGRLLTAHHHLSETTILDEDDKDADEADRNDDVAGMLAEGWRAGITVTTFVQLFESLAGPSNKQSMKLPALRDSVVVLDEPQSLPLDWWKLVQRLVQLLTEQYDATVIAMTATQPKLFDDPTKLVDDPDVYFEATARVAYELDPSTERYIDSQDGPKSYTDAAAILRDALDAGEASLAVCNTIDSARTLTDEVTDGLPNPTRVGEIYTAALDALDEDDEAVDPEHLADRIMNQSDRSVLHLSTRIRPVDRLVLIETAKQLTENGHPLITVSTQLIEAGVDISFDRVYRDLAPIDSIVQAAGRCNRSFERDRGQVTIWWLDVPDEQEKTPAEAVYNRGATLLPVAAETLDSVCGSERQMSEYAVAREGVTSYYETLHKDKDVGKEAYAGYVNDAMGDELEGLSLIEQRNAVDVVVCRTQSERDYIEDIRDAWRSYEFDRVRQLMDELKETRVSIPIYRADSDEAQKLGQLSRIHDDTDVRWLDTRQHNLKQYFDECTGFVVPESTAERRII